MNLFYVCILAFVSFNLAVADYAKYVEFIKKQSHNSTFVKEFEKHVKLFHDESVPTQVRAEEFPCEVMEKPSRPSINVHNLTPMDINVMGALGDSITAGLGITADSIIGLLFEERGLSWSIGGDGSIDNHETLVNIIKRYNPKVKGFSTGVGGVNSAGSRLNVADSGAKSEDMPGQADLLIERMKADTSIDFENDWKIITMFIGGNDLCDYCDDKDYYSPENYVNNIQSALDILHENVPKALVNLVEVLNIANVNELRANALCGLIHLFACRCGSFPSEAEKEVMLEAVKGYQNGLSTLVNTGRYDTKDDFTVVVQPFFRETPIPKKPGTDEADLSYFSPDCFHLSLKGQEAAAEALWNNMVEPVGKKRIKWSPDEPVDCPTAEQPYFYTSKNSGTQTNIRTDLQNTDTKAVLQNTDTQKTGKEETSSFNPIIAIVGVCVLVVMVIVSVVAMKRKSSSKEQEKLLKQEMPLSYTEI